MPLFNDLKKLFFGAKSVAKHQAGKAGENAKEAGDELSRQGSELVDLTKAAALDLASKTPGYIRQGKDALSDLGDAVFKVEEKPKRTQTEEAGDIIDEELDFGKLNLSKEPDAPKSGSIDFEDDLQDSASVPPPREPSAFEQVRDSTLDSAARAGLKAKDAAGKLGDDLLSRAATAGAGLKGKADAFVEHANREAEKMKMEETIEQAKAAAEQAEARARAFDKKEHERETDESTLSGTDSFFDRADRFARGDYHNEGGKDVRLQDDPDYRPKQKGNLIAGFDDADGDGDSLIDDAIIDAEEE